MSTRRAQCTCGQLSAICSGDPLRVSVCHCLACKRLTGSAFNYAAHWRKRDVVIEGQATEFTRKGDDGGLLTRGFCPTCGERLYGRNSGLPHIISIPVGAFADTDFAAPTYSAYHASRKHKWFEIVSEPLETRG